MRIFNDCINNVGYQGLKDVGWEDLDYIIKLDEYYI